jgi:hypothetical protein
VTIETTYRTPGRAYVGPIITPAERLDAYQRALVGIPVLARPRRNMEAEVFFILAGPLAKERAQKEGLVLKEPAPPDSKSPEGRALQLQEFVLEGAAIKSREPKYPSDRERVMDLLGGITANDAEATTYFDYLFARADTLVSTPGFWTPCCALAEALLEKETLSGRAARKIIRSSFEPRPSKEAQELASQSTRTTRTWRS